jgi:hypothetical protein
MTDGFPRTRTVIVARLLVAVVIAVAALVGGAQVEFVPIVVLGVIVAGLTGVYLLWDRFGHMRWLLLNVQFTVDIVFVTLVVYFSGGLASPFKLLYFLPVIVGSARLGIRAGTAFAAEAVVGYLVLSVVDPGGWRYLEESGASAICPRRPATLAGSSARPAANSRPRDCGWRASSTTSRAGSCWSTTTASLST